MFLIKELPDKKSIKKVLGETDIDTAAVAAVLAMLKASSDVMVLTDKFFTAKGMSHSRFNALAFLSRRPDGMYPNELADEMGISRATASTILKGMEVTGLVTSAKAENDGRMKKIVITGKGVSTYETVLPEYYALLAKTAGKNDKKELKAAAETAKNISEAVSTVK